MDYSLRMKEGGGSISCYIDEATFRLRSTNPPPCSRYTPLDVDRT